MSATRQSRLQILLEAEDAIKKARELEGGLIKVEGAGNKADQGIRKTGMGAKQSAGALLGLATAAGAAFFAFDNLEKKQLAVTKASRQVQEKEQSVAKALRDNGRNSQEYADAVRDLGIAKETLSIRTGDVTQAQVAFAFQLTTMGVSVIPSAIQAMRGLSLASINFRSILTTISAHPVFLVVSAGILAWEFGISKLIKNMNGMDLSIGGNIEKLVGINAQTKDITRSTAEYTDELSGLPTVYDSAASSGTNFNSMLGSQERNFDSGIRKMQDFGRQYGRLATIIEQDGKRIIKYGDFFEVLNFSLEEIKKNDKKLDFVSEPLRGWLRRPNNQVKLGLLKGVQYPTSSLLNMRVGGAADRAIGNRLIDQVIERGGQLAEILARSLGKPMTGRVSTPQHILTEIAERKEFSLTKEGLTQKLWQQISRAGETGGRRGYGNPFLAFGRTESSLIKQFGFNDTFTDIREALTSGLITQMDIRGISPQQARDLIIVRNQEKQMQARTAPYLKTGLTMGEIDVILQTRGDDELRHMLEFNARRDMISTGSVP